MSVSAALRGERPASRVRLANAYPVEPTASVAYVSGPSAVGLSPPQVQLVSSLQVTSLAVEVSVVAGGALGTATFQLDVGGSVSGPFTTAAEVSVATTGVYGLTLYFGAGTYDASNAWTWNLGSALANAVGPEILALGMKPVWLYASATLVDSADVRMMEFDAPRTVTLPAKPWDGMTITIRDAATVAATNSVIIQAGSSQTVENPYQPGDFSSDGGSWPLVIDGQAVTYRYLRTTGTFGAWFKVADSAASVLPTFSLANTSTPLALIGRALVKASTSGGASVFVQLPASPACDGLAVCVKDVGGSAASYAIAVAPEGSGWTIEYPKGTVGAVGEVATNYGFAEWFSDVSAKTWWLRGTL